MSKLPAGRLLLRCSAARFVRLGCFCVLFGVCRRSSAQQAQAGAATAPSTTPSSAQIRGEVLGQDGAPLAGAQVSLLCRAGTPPQTAVSDTDGHFTFPILLEGSCSLTAALTGFTEASRDVTLALHQPMELEPILLSLATVHVTVDAITEEQLAAQELHNEEQQRLVGLLPNFFVAYNWTAPPLSTRQKYTLSLHNVLDPGNLALVGVVAGIQQADNAFPGYGQGAAGYGRRYGADLGNLVVGTFMGGAVLPSLFHQDPRYFYKGSGTYKARFLYAISRSVITRGDNGHSEPNFAGVLGDLSAGAISNLYYPASDRQGAKLFLENGLLGVAGDAMNNFFQEFVLPHFTTHGKANKGTSQP